MSYNVIFLDVDGELTYSDFEKKETANIDIEKVKILKKISDDNNAKIVISSSWRGSENYTPHIYQILIDILTENGLDVVGDTPYIKTEFKNKDNNYCDSLDKIESEEFKIIFGTGRAAEIQKYIKDNNVSKFLILDDEDWDWKSYGFDKMWIQPTWYGNGGLKEEHISLAKKIFDSQNK